VQAIAEHDRDGARQAMTDHLESTRQAISGPSGSLRELIRTLYTN
jgi:DNA-binding FadR family transcriptional regulator